MTDWQPGDPLYRRPIFTSAGWARPMFEVLSQPSLGDTGDQWTVRFPDEPEAG